MEEVDEVAPGLPLPQRFRQCLRRGGMAITVTSITNVSAFLFGSATSIPAVRPVPVLCAYTCLAMLFLTTESLQLTCSSCCCHPTAGEQAFGVPSTAS